MGKTGRRAVTPEERSRQRQARADTERLRRARILDHRRQFLVNLMKKRADALAELPDDVLELVRPGVTHVCPPDGSIFMPCCGSTLFSVPRTDRVTDNPALVTCTGAAA